MAERPSEVPIPVPTGGPPRGLSPKVWIAGLIIIVAILLAIFGLRG
jgi:hypothetical protein